MGKPVFVLTGRRRPHNVLLLLYSLVIGTAILAGLVPRPRTMTMQLNGTQVTMWATGLALSGLLGLIGAFWQGDVTRGLRLERSAMLIGAGAVLGFAWSIGHLGRVAVFSTGFCIAWGIANLVLAKYIGEDLRSLGRVNGDGVRGGESGRSRHRRSYWWRNRGGYSGVQSPPQGQGGFDGHPERPSDEVPPGGSGRR